MKYLWRIILVVPLTIVVLLALLIDFPIAFLFRYKLNLVNALTPLAKIIDKKCCPEDFSES